MNLHLIQADNAIRQDLLIRNEDELIHAMNHFELRGGGGTDFRPAFAYVDQLCAEKSSRTCGDCSTLPTAWAPTRQSARPTTRPSCFRRAVRRRQCAAPGL